MNFVNEPRIFVFFGNSQKFRLFRDGKSGKAPTEKRHFNGFKTSPGESGKISFNCVSHVFGTHIAASCGDGFLIAENAVVGAAAVRYKDRYDSMFFHVNSIPQTIEYGIINAIISTVLMQGD